MSLEKQISAGAQARGRPLLTLVIPTRNEAKNVPRLVRELKESLLGVDYRIVFVDDSSDETPEVIRDLCEEDGQIVLIRREKTEQGGGLSTAVAAGMDAVVNESEYTCVMDADLQHPPGKVREMLEKARASGADVVVASRYARGGSYAGLPGPVRKGISVGSKYLAQIVFKEARKTSDPMTGFFLVKNVAISGIQFRPTGFKILLEILVCAPELKVVEVPMSFQARNAGISKANVWQGLGYLAHIVSLFWYVPSAGRFWKFALVGASGVLVNLLTLITLVEYFDAGPTVAWIVAVGVSILSNFLLNNAFTWRDVRHSSRIHFLLRGALAYPVAIVALGANFAVYYPLINYLGADFPYYAIAAFLGIVAGTSSNFILSSRFIFRPPALKGLDPTAPPEAIVEEAREELKADWVALIRAGDLSPVAQSSSGVANASRSLTTADKSAIGLVLRTSQPTLVVTGPRRLPQARTNTRWMNSLAVPVLIGDRPVGVVYATRNSTEQFTQEDLHWLTAYASTSGSIFH
ncbi:MAG: dolichol-phosphate mannosyltransferase [Rubrobacteraceae bacterium]|nr:dolichol-phosphate mannosyltransferase [Rubrobacteraceae bacterium]